MTTKYTQGPWEAVTYGRQWDACRVKTEKGDLVALVYGARAWENEANARLIAAAPGMLDLLKLFVEPENTSPEYMKALIKQTKSILEQVKGV